MAAAGGSRPVRRLYEDNYAYGAGFYQPMIDYLDAKAQGKHRRTRRGAEPPHLPWSEERGVGRYKTLGRSYSEHDLHRLAAEAEAQARVDLGTFRVARRSVFSLSKSASAASVTKHLEQVTGHKAREVEARLAMSGAARDVEAQLMAEGLRSFPAEPDHLADIRAFQRRPLPAAHDPREHDRFMEERKKIDLDALTRPLDQLRIDLVGFEKKTADYFQEKSKQTSIEIEQLNARVVEAETRLKTEVTRIKKKLQIQITELELSLDVANKNNIELQKTIKKQSLQLTELQAHYDEVQRQLAVTLDQYGIAQRKLQSIGAELEEVRGNYESALRAKRTVEQQYEESVSRINELTTINVNISSAKSKIEQELSTLAGDYDEVTRELRASDERYQRVQVELKRTVETLHEEQERIVKIEAIKKSLEIEVKNLTVRLEEVEANAIVGGKRIISKLEARLRDLELELDEEKRRHAETLKILRKKERTVKEVIIQQEEDQKNISLLQESLDKANQRIQIYKRQLQETEGMSQQSVTRVRRFQRELEAAEDRADTAESNLSLIRAKHRTFVTTSSVPGSQVYLVRETQHHTTTTETM